MNYERSRRGQSCAEGRARLEAAQGVRSLLASPSPRTLQGDWPEALEAPPILSLEANCPSDFGNSVRAGLVMTAPPVADG